MLVLNGSFSAKCSLPEYAFAKGTEYMRFTVSGVNAETLGKLFGDGGFYFYDELLCAKLPDTFTGTLTGLAVTYNADSTYTVKLKLKQKEKTL